MSRRRQARDELPSAGDRVRDRDTGDALVVIEVLDGTTAEDHMIGATGRSVAAHNPEYDPEDAVVVAAYSEDVAEASLGDLRRYEDDEDALRVYHFPAGRLAVDEGGDPR